MAALGKIKCGVKISTNGYDRIRDSFSSGKFEDDGIPLEPQAADQEKMEDKDSSHDGHSENEGDAKDGLSIEKGPKIMFLEIDCCMDLQIPTGRLLKDLMGQKSDINPFVIVKVNDKEVGRTPLVKDSVNPFWIDEYYQFPINEKSSVVLEVWSVRVPRDANANSASFRNEQLVGKASIPISTIPLTNNDNVEDVVCKLTMVDKRVDFDDSNPVESDAIVEGHDYRIDPPKTLRLRKELEDMTSEKNSFFESTLFKLIGIMIAYFILGVVAYSFLFEEWPIVDSLYFSTVTLTTVGYGDLSPTTTRSIIFTCFFSLIGTGVIGMALLNLIGVVMVNTTVKNLNGHKEEPTGAEKEDDEEFSKPLLFRAWFLYFGGAASLVTAASMIGYFESWSFLKTLYWCIITGTTIGYGDYSPQIGVTRWIAFVVIPFLVILFGMFLAKLSDAFVNKELEKINEQIYKREITSEDLAKMDADQDNVVTELEFFVYMLKELDKIDQALVDKLKKQYQSLDPDADGIRSEDLKQRLQDRLKKTRSDSMVSYKRALLYDNYGSEIQSNSSNV